MTRTIKHAASIAVLSLLVLILASPAAAISLVDVHEGELAAAVDCFVDDVAKVTGAFCFDLYTLDHPTMAEKALSTDDAAEIFAFLDIHVDSADIAEIKFVELYDILVELLMESSPAPTSELQHLKTLSALFTAGKQPTEWQVFTVCFRADDVCEFLAIHRPSGTMYAIEIGR